MTNKCWKLMETIKKLHKKYEVHGGLRSHLTPFNHPRYGKPRTNQGYYEYFILVPISDYLLGSRVTRV